MTTPSVPQEALGVYAPQPSASLVAVLASLPLSFRAVAEPGGAVHAVRGDRGWAQRCLRALRLDARAVVVEDPSPEDVEDVEALRVDAAHRGAPVVLAEGWAGAASLAAAAAAWPGALTAAGLVEVVLRSAQEPLEPRLLEVVRVLRACEQSVPAANWKDASVTAGDGGVAVVARAGATTWSLLLVRAPADRLSLSACGAADQVLVELPSALTAASGSARRVTPTGEEGLGAVYESAHRGAWRQVADALRTGAVAAGDRDEASSGRAGGGDVLAELVVDLQAVRDLTDRLGAR